MRHVAILTFAGLFSVGASAADQNLQFSIRGAGLIKCSTFLEERADQTPAYLMIAGWLDGYITGVNQYASDTYDMTPYQSSEMLMLIVNRHCESNPDDLMFGVANSMLNAFQSNRLKEFSQFRTVRVDSRQTRLYQAVIERIQQQLRSKGFLDQEPSGNWDESTERALADFQTSIEFDATGYPDQSTLWQLLSESAD